MTSCQRRFACLAFLWLLMLFSSRNVKEVSAHGLEPFTCKITEMAEISEVILPDCLLRAQLSFLHA